LFIAFLYNRPYYTLFVAVLCNTPCYTFLYLGRCSSIQQTLLYLVRCSSIQHTLRIELKRTRYSSVCCIELQRTRYSKVCYENIMHYSEEHFLIHALYDYLTKVNILRFLISPLVSSNFSYFFLYFYKEYIIRYLKFGVVLTRVDFNNYNKLTDTLHI
jgi:hypothetical protein